MTEIAFKCFDFIFIFFKAKQVLELVGQSQSTYGDMLTELGLSSAMRPQAEYTLLAPINAAFNGEQIHVNLPFPLFN